MYFSIKEILKTDSSKMVLENEAEPDNHDEVADENLNYTMKWVNLFGSNKDSGSGKHAEVQNVDISKATQFNGRVLVEYYVYDCKHPEMKIDRGGPIKTRVFPTRLIFTHLGSFKVCRGRLGAGDP